MDRIKYFQIALKERFKEKGTQSNLAIDTKISDTYLSQLANFKRANPSRKKIIQICDALKTTYEDMVNEGKRISVLSTLQHLPDTSGSPPECHGKQHPDTSQIQATLLSIQTTLIHNQSLLLDAQARITKIEDEIKEWRLVRQERPDKKRRKRA